jgi:hypothetical protein
MELRQMIAANTTWTVPLDWSISQTDSESNYIIIRQMTINGEDIQDLDIRSLDGQNFKVVLELWRYDPQVKDFVFEWVLSQDTRSVWNQIWFNVKA